MRHLDLFSGIGGFALATEMVWPSVEHFFCEIDPFCQAVLRKHWPKSHIYGDIRELRGDGFGSIDLVTGGFPCQPFSNAGQQKGNQDDRDLWPEMFRIIKESKPTWIIGENVAGFIEMELERSVSDLESEGYEVQPIVIPACAVNAPHRRDRVWIVAYSPIFGDSRRPKEIPRKNGRQKWDYVSESFNATNLHDSSNSNGTNVQGSVTESRSNRESVGTNPFSSAWEARKSLLPETVLCRADDGIPNRMDRTKSLGNAIVPQVAAEIMRAFPSPL